MNLGLPDLVAIESTRKRRRRRWCSKKEKEERRRNSGRFRRRHRVLSSDSLYPPIDLENSSPRGPNRKLIRPTRFPKLREMWRLTIVIGMIAIARAGPYDRMMVSMNDRTLFIRSLPGYPGTRSDLYEVYMEPYYFAIGLKAVAELRALSEDGSPVNGPRGILTLEQHPEGVKVTGTITGLSPGLHGFHVHEKGDLTKGCNSAGPHFNPYMVNHGAPSDPLRHVGDLGNIEVGQDGVAQINGIDHYLSLVGVRGAIGRALVIHEKPDDLGRGGTQESLKTGSAGARVACGVIGFL